MTDYTVRIPLSPLIPLQCCFPLPHQTVPIVSPWSYYHPLNYSQHKSTAHLIITVHAHIITGDLLYFFDAHIYVL